MPKQVHFRGTDYDFPDNVTDEQVSAFLKKKALTSGSPGVDKPNPLAGNTEIRQETTADRFRNAIGRFVPEVITQGGAMGGAALGAAADVPVVGAGIGGGLGSAIANKLKQFAPSLFGQPSDSPLTDSVMDAVTSGVAPELAGKLVGPALRGSARFLSKTSPAMREVMETDRLATQFNKARGFYENTPDRLPESTFIPKYGAREPAWKQVEASPPPLPESSSTPVTLKDAAKKPEKAVRQALWKKGATSVYDLIPQEGEKGAERLSMRSRVVDEPVSAPSTPGSDPVIPEIKPREVVGTQEGPPNPFAVAENERLAKSDTQMKQLMGRGYSPANKSFNPHKIYDELVKNPDTYKDIDPVTKNNFKEFLEGAIDEKSYKGTSSPLIKAARGGITLSLPVAAATALGGFGAGATTATLILGSEMGLRKLLSNPATARAAIQATKSGVDSPAATTLSKVVLYGLRGSELLLKTPDGETVPVQVSDDGQLQGRENRRR